MKILGASDDNYVMILGPNATSLFQLLAWKYSSSDFLSGGDEIVIAEENHLANVDPWLKLAEMRQMKVKWWSCAKKKSELDSGNGILSTDLLQLGISHSSNILGMVINIKRICTEVKRKYPK